MPLAPAQDSQRFLALLPETAYATLPDQRILSTATGGTFTLRHRDAPPVTLRLLGARPHP